MSCVCIRESCVRFSSFRNRAGAAILLALTLGAGAVFGQGRTLWQDGGVQLCGPSASGDPVATSDGAGGAIVVWADSRQWPDGIYAQRVDAAGVPLWTEDGILVCDSTGQGPFDVIDDGEHGAITGWSLYNLSFAVQRVSAEGVPLWGSNGLTLRPAGDNLGECAALVRDGHGGAIVVWSTFGLNLELDTLIACRVDSSGSKLWETVVRIDTLGVDPPCLCEDGMGGVIVAWSKGNLGPVRVKRVDSAGAIRWDSAGVLACTLSTTKTVRACVAVGDSCFVVGFAVGPDWHNRAQMFDLAGNRQWGLTGVPVAGTSYSSMGGLGLFAGGRRQSTWLWCENRTGTYDFFAQVLDSTGTRRWDTTGVFFGSSDTSPWGFSATDDSRGGAIVGWPLHRNGLNWDIYAQHVDSAGHPCWNDTGLAVCLDPNRQQWAPTNVTDGDGGAILAWRSYESGVGSSIYAQRVADVEGVEETMGDERRMMNVGPTVIRGVLSLQPAIHNLQSEIGLLDISGRKVLDLKPGANDVRALAPGVYFVRFSAGPKVSTGRLTLVR